MQSKKLHNTRQKSDGEGGGGGGGRVFLRCVEQFEARSKVQS